MARQVREAVRRLLPPAALPFVRWLMINVGRRAPEWEYVSATWPEGDARHAGWQHPSVAAAQRRRWADFVSMVRSTQPFAIEYEADRVKPDSISAQSAFLAFLYVLARAANTRLSVSVLDWGGGLGYHAVVARAALPTLELDYTVKELPEISCLGQELLPDIRFTSDAEACFARRYDLVLASNSVQYTRDWPALLRRLSACANEWVFLTRLPLVETAEQFVVVQRPHRIGYQTEYLSWVLNRNSLVAESVAAGLVLEREFAMREDRCAVVRAPEPYHERGLLFRRAFSPPRSPTAPFEGVK